MNGSVDGSDIDIDDNLILKYENELRRQFDIHIRPSITINNITYRGDWEAGEILLAICSGYSQKP